ncbi:Translation initiation factor IF2/IF5 [Macleaya cordata]|uniref:Translation initiation factor IF2/IF5 n=1 Tax=Macleaya cordata TaxID=56857 RepID=A0A200Q2T3_MACCD|nr:Translation initiation factor IF2/IF5 [Macleaya cordata]
MDLQNIGAGNRDDAFYRYKMPRMITKIEGRGNGIKTNVVNMVDIAKALARPASYTTKYFGCELGAQSKFDEKTGVSLVNGAHDTAKLAGLLENFIKKFVQCYGCGNPETEIIITKTQMIQLKCAACGFVSDVDMRDKLTTFILKNPPEQKKGSRDKKAMRRAEKERLKEGEAADEELKKIKKEVKKKGTTTTKDATSKAAPAKKKVLPEEDHHSSPSGSQADDNEVDDDEDDVQWHTDTSLEAARQRIQEQLSAVTAEMVMLSTNESEKEKPKPAKKLVATTNGGTPEPEVKSPRAVENGKETVGAHEKLVEKIKMNMKGSTVSQLKSFLGSLDDGSPQEVMNALLDALFGGVEKGFSKEVTKKKNYLAAATQDDEGSQILLLRAIDGFCAKSSPEVVKEVALVLKTLYDADVLEEEYVVQWYEEGLAGGSKNSQIWKNIKPFIEWLQSAESESE